MQHDLVTGLLPTLGRSTVAGFNVFDVMHHGLHEKQISNVFRWLLETDASHRLGARFLRIFLSEANSQLGERPVKPDEDYWVRQEVNTSGTDDLLDIADIVLESRAAVLVVENYFTSDGHGHSYQGYLAFAERDGKAGAVVLLCGEHDASRQRFGWERAPVLTYERLAARLYDELESDRRYQRENPEAWGFIEQMYRKFVKGRGRVADHDVLGFVVAMCQTGEAGRYQEMKQDAAAERFASDLAEQARARFGEGRELLQQVKGRLRSYSADVLATQLNATLGDGCVTAVSARYAGIYQWTINFDIVDPGDDFGEGKLQIKFGPSAWFANERDDHWTTKPATEADYSRLFLTRSSRREIRQSSVAIHEVLAGFEPGDSRLHDEIVALVGEPR